MDNVFLLKLLVSFVIGGVWVIAATVLADKFGSKVGGLVAGLPSTVMFGLFFLAWTQNNHAAVQATTIIPIIGGINCLFLVSYIFLIKTKKIWTSLLASLSLWGLLSFGLILLKFDNYFFSIVGYILSLILSYYLLEYVLRVQSLSGKKQKYTRSIILMRGLISGFIIAFSVYIGKVGGPILGGMFSMFPAMFISTILITYFSQGPLFSAATMKSSMLSGISIVIYSVLVRYTYTSMGILWGTLVSLVGSFLSGFVMYKFVVTKLK